MTTNISEGDSFPPGYLLNKRLSQNPVWESWISTNEQTGERSFVRVSDTHAAADWAAQVEALDAIQGLVHPHINLAHSHGREGNLHFIIEPYLSNAMRFEPKSVEPWPIIKQLLDVLIYIQRLGLCHGNIHPDNLLIEGGDNLKITGMGLRSHRPQVYQQYMSPQILSGTEADITDDTYALGCLIYSCLARKTVGPGEQPDAPLPTALRPMLEQMTSDSVLDRNLPLPDIKERFRAYYENSDNQINIGDFVRPKQSDAQLNQDSQVVTRQSRAVSIQWVGFALIALLSVGLGIFMLLPEDGPTKMLSEYTEITQDPAKDPAVTRVAASPDENAPAPFQAARLEHMQEEGQRVARSILKLQLDLEDHGVLLWAKEKFMKLSEDLDKADGLFRGGNYAAAIATYLETLNALKMLQSEKPTRLAEEVAKGDAALEFGDYTVALISFTISSAIAPNAPDIKAKLRRAENLEKVLNLVRSAELAESEAKYSAALDIFKTARELDGLWEPALEGVNRMAQAIKMQQFQKAMSDAFKSIGLRNYQAAKDHFAKAQLILPESQEPADGLAQVAQSQTNDAINKKREEATVYVDEKNWQQAIIIYEGALAISGNLDFAKQGLEYAKRRLDLDKQLTKYLSDPTLLQSDEGLSAAASILKEASTISPGGADHEREINSLAKLISTARIQIPVTIRSNGKTFITVRKQFSLGNIESETIFLIPGKYIITGQRPGYRDIREELVLIAGKPLSDIFIASTERVR